MVSIVPGTRPAPEHYGSAMLVAVEKDVYTTGQAARILGVTDRGVRKMIDRGELEAATDERGRHRIPQREVHRLLQERREAAKGAASSLQPAQDATAVAQEAAELRLRLEQLQRDLGRLEGRLELTEQAESTVREQLVRERAELQRERAIREEERERADAELERMAEQVLDERTARGRLQDELADARRPWWRKIFGG